MDASGARNLRFTYFTIKGQIVRCFLLLVSDSLFRTQRIILNLFLESNHPFHYTNSSIDWTFDGSVIFWGVPQPQRDYHLSDLQKPTMRDSRPAQSLANARLKEMGSMSKDELIMALACGFTITMWVLGGFLGQSLHQIILMGEDLSAASVVNTAVSYHHLILA